MLRFRRASLQPVRKMLEARGISRLYTHQAEAFQLCGEGKNVVVVTPTASGKTLCYNLPDLAHPGGRPGRPRDVPVSHQGAG